MFVKVGLPEHQHGAAQRFCLHPALLDAALHTVVLGLLGERTGTTLPFSWTGVTLHAVGVRGLRVRLRPVGADEVAVDIADTTGAPVATIESLALRTVSPERLRSGSPRETSLFRLDWMPVARTASEPLDAVLLGADALGLAERLEGVTPWTDGARPDLVLADCVGDRGSRGGACARRAGAGAHPTVAR